jgi:hypothetical protein
MRIAWWPSPGSSPISAGPRRAAVVADHDTRSGRSQPADGRSANAAAAAGHNRNLAGEWWGVLDGHRHLFGFSQPFRGKRRSYKSQIMAGASKL